MLFRSVLAGQVSSATAMNAALRIADNYLAQIGTAVESAQFEQQGGMSMRADAAVGEEVSGLVLGVPREYFVEEGVDPDVLSRVREAVAELERAGAKTREVSLPHTRYAVATYYLIATAEASSNLARYDGVRYGHRA